MVEKSGRRGKHPLELCVKLNRCIQNPYSFLPRLKLPDNSKPTCTPLYLFLSSLHQEALPFFVLTWLHQEAFSFIEQTGGRHSSGRGFLSMANR